MSEQQSGNNSPSDLVRIWRPRALAIGCKTKTPDKVSRFLESKGVPRQQASEAAIVIWNEAKKSRMKRNRPKLIVGWILIVVGLLNSSYMILTRSSFSSLEDFVISTVANPAFYSTGYSPVVLGGVILYLFSNDN